MEISNTHHQVPGASRLPAVANRLLQQAQQALGASETAAAAESQAAVGIQGKQNPAAPGIQSRANGIDRTLDASVPGADRSTVSPEERQKLVLRPSAVPVEKRLEQVMSLEDVQRLLLVRSPMPEAPGLHRQSNPAPGQLLDFHS
ncbi:MAG: hypothetical protein NXI24_10915 [bacterium]|nr:hypothetical protein [bacterium]